MEAKMKGFHGEMNQDPNANVNLEKTSRFSLKMAFFSKYLNFPWDIPRAGRNFAG